MNDTGKIMLIRQVVPKPEAILAEIEVFTQLSPAHVRINEADFLAGLGRNDREVHGSKGLPRLRRRTGYDDALGFRVKHAKMQTRTKAAKGFHCKVDRAGDRENGPRLLPAIDRFCRYRLVDGREYRNAQSLYLLCALNAFLEHVANKNESRADRSPKQQAQHKDHALVRRYRRGGRMCRIQNTHVANRTCLKNAQLLRTVQKVEVSFFRQFETPRPVKHFSLSLWQGFGFAAKSCDPIFQVPLVVKKLLIGRVLRCVSFLKSLLFELNLT